MSGLRSSERSPNLRTPSPPPQQANSPVEAILEQPTTPQAHQHREYYVNTTFGAVS